jgi:hypothetical protein
LLPSKPTLTDTLRVCLRRLFFAPWSDFRREQRIVVLMSVLGGLLLAVRGRLIGGRLLG